MDDEASERARTDYRPTTVSLFERTRRHSFQEEDERWARPRQVRDWLILAGLMLINVVWMLLAYFFEPGLR